MMDQITLEQLRLAARQGGAQPIATLAALAASLAARKAVVADAEARLNAGLEVRFGEMAWQLRVGKDSGRVRIGDGLFVVVANLPKRVEWDQDTLAAIVARIHGAGDDPTEYVRTIYEVSGRAYGAWPSPIRRLFEPARTVKVAKPRYAIETRCEEAA